MTTAALATEFGGAGSGDFSDSYGGEISFFPVTPPPLVKADTISPSMMPPLYIEPSVLDGSSSFLSNVNSNNVLPSSKKSLTSVQQYTQPPSITSTMSSKTDSSPTTESGTSTMTLVIIAFAVVLVVVLGIFLFRRFTLSPSSPSNSNSGVNNSSDHGVVKKTVKFQDQAVASGTFDKSGVIETESAWQQLVSGAAQGKHNVPVVVAFTMTGCGPCSNLKPALMDAINQSNSSSSANGGKEVRIYNLNFNGEEWKQNAMIQHDVTMFPTIKRFQPGQPIAKNSNGMIEFNGPRTAENILAFAHNA